MSRSPQHHFTQVTMASPGNGNGNDSGDNSISDEHEQNTSLVAAVNTSFPSSIDADDRTSSPSSRDHLHRAQQTSLEVAVQPPSPNPHHPVTHIMFVRPDANENDDNISPSRLNHMSQNSPSLILNPARKHTNANNTLSVPQNNVELSTIKNASTILAQVNRDNQAYRERASTDSSFTLDDLNDNNKPQPPPPTSFSDALRQLREAREEIASLQKQLDYDTTRAFASRGADHSTGNFGRSHEPSFSHTRNGREMVYAGAEGTNGGSNNGNGSIQLDDDMNSIPQPVPCCCGLMWTRSAGEHSQVTLEQYFSTPWYWLLAKRLPWLISLLILQSFNASILAAYDSFLSNHLIFTFFIPMVVGTAGNSGNQCSVMVTRSLALGLGDRDVWRVIKKEAPIACIMSVFLGICAFIRVAIEYPNLLTSGLAIGITLSIGILLAIALGILFSYGIEKIRCCDPADGATPLLSTISDLIGISILCGVAVAMVGRE